MSGKTFDEAFRSDLPEPCVCKRGRRQPGRRLPASHRNEANYGAEDEPIGSRMLIGKLRPAETAATHQAATYLQPVRPFNRDRRFGRSQRRERIGDRGHAGIEAAPGAPKLLLWLEQTRILCRSAIG